MNEEEKPIGFDETPPETEEEEKPVSITDSLSEIEISGGMTGATTKVKINGEEIHCLESVRFEAVAGKVSKVILTVIPKSVTICALGELQVHEQELYSPQNIDELASQLAVGIQSSLTKIPRRE